MVRCEWPTFVLRAHNLHLRVCASVQVCISVHFCAFVCAPATVCKCRQNNAQKTVHGKQCTENSARKATHRKQVSKVRILQTRADLRAPRQRRPLAAGLLGLALRAPKVARL